MLFSKGPSTQNYTDKLMLQFVEVYSGSHLRLIRFSFENLISEYVALQCNEIDSSEDTWKFRIG